MTGSLRLTRLTFVGAAVLLVLYGVPIVWLVVASLKTSADIFRGDVGLIFTPSFAAYQQILNQGLVRATGNSAIIACSVTLLTTGLAVPAAYALARIRGSLVVLGLSVVILLQMTPQTATVIPLYRVLGTWGLLSLGGVILADTGLLLPFCILLLRPFFLSVPKEIEEAAAVDGATRWRVFGEIVLPLAMNGAATAATVIFLISWGEFLYAISFLVDPTQYTISVLIASQVGQYGIEWPLLMAVAVMASLPILVVFAFTYRLLKQGLALGGGR